MCFRGDHMAEENMNQQKQQQLNRALVLRLLRQKGPCSRAELATYSGLKRATITHIMNELLEVGLVVESGWIGRGKGRRSIELCFNDERYCVIGVMLTRSFYSISVMGLSGKTYGTWTYPIAENEAAQRTILHICSRIQCLIERVRANILAVGFAVPGPYKVENGELLFLTNLNGWDGIPLRAVFREAFDIPVIIENDANAGAIACHFYRSQETDMQQMAYIVAGEGIGCGMISDGELMKGNDGIAGEIGHTSICYNGIPCQCGNRGCLEQYCSMLSLKRDIQDRIRNGTSSCLPLDFSTQELIQAIRQKDPLAVESYENACHFLAIGIVNLVNQFNPRVIIIGDTLAELEPTLMLKIVKEDVHRLLRPLLWEQLVIEIDNLPYNPILLGAGTIVAKKVFEDPFSFVERARKEDVVANLTC